MKSSTTTALVILLATSTTSVYADVEQQQPKQGQPHDFESANIEYIQQHFNERTAAATKDKKSTAATFAADKDETKSAAATYAADKDETTFKSDMSSSISQDQEHALPTTREFSSTEESFENKKVADVSFNDFANYYWDTLQKHMEEVKEDITAVGGEHLLLTSNQGFDADSLDDENANNSQDENQGVDDEDSSPEDIVVDDEKVVDDNTKVADISFNDFNKYYWKNIEERMQQVDESKSSNDTDEQEEDEAKLVDVKAIASSRRNLRGIGDGSTSTMMYNKSKSDYIIPNSRGDGDYMIPQLRAKLEE